MLALLLCLLLQKLVVKFFCLFVVFFFCQDTFDIRICLARSNKYVIDFQSADETDLHVMDIPLSFSIMQSGMVHGLAFWFDCGFLGSE